MKLIKKLFWKYYAPYLRKKLDGKLLHMYGERLKMIEPGDIVGTDAGRRLRYLGENQFMKTNK